MKISKRPLFVALVVFSLGCLLAVEVNSRLRESQQALKAERFDTLAQRTARQLKRRIQTYEYGLRGARGAVIVAGAEALSRTQFLTYSQSRELEREFPGSRGFGFIRRVSAAQEAAFLRRARADGKPDFTVRQLVPHAGERLIIQYIEPEARNRQAVGLDIASESNRLLAALAAVRSGNPTLTKPITLVQERGKAKRGFLLLLPAYRPYQPLDTPAQRWSATFGLVYTPLIIDEVLADFDLVNGEISLTLEDDDYAAAPDRFYSSPGADEPETDGLTKRIPLSLYGRNWLVKVKARPAFVNKLNLDDTNHIGAEIVSIAGLLAILTYFYLGNRERQHQAHLVQARMAAIVENSTDAIIGKSLDGVVTSWNKGAEHMFGHTFAEAMNQRVSDLIFPAELLIEENEILARVGNGETIPYFNTMRRHKNGTLIDVSATVSPIHGPGGRVVGVATTLRDITEQKRVEARILELNASLEAQVTQRTAELHRALKMAEQANHAKSEFLANMSHEIRTPMNAVLGLCYLLEKQNLTPLTRDMVQKIHASGRSLLSIINDILDFSKIEANRLIIEQVPFCLSDVLDNLASILASAMGGKPIEVVVSPAPVGADFLKGDALRLGQVLINLAGNVVKFTEAGEVVVSTEIVGQENDRVRLRFRVRDTGIGISPDKQALIFDAFTQANSSTTRSFGGTGLGLTISRHLVQLMGGRLEVSSAPGKGSIFGFELSFELSDPSRNALPEMLHQRILIADDQETARKVLADTASSLGWHVETTHSGDQAVEIAAKPMLSAYDIILLDWRMPGLDGLGAAVSIRDQLSHAETPIIIMVTAHDRERLLDEPGSVAVDTILTKPVTASSLYNAVLEAKSRRGELQMPTLVRQDSKRLVGLNVLVVDDSEINREVAQRILVGEGAEVLLAEDGADALAQLNSQPEWFDLVLMDVQMPIMDGYTATGRIRATPELAHLPVVALTAGAFKSQQDAAYAAGVNDFVAKPFDVDQLVAVCRRLTQKEDSATVERKRSPSPVSLRQSGGSAIDPDMVLDVERGLEIWRDVEAYKKYLRKFARDYGQSLNNFDASTPDLAAFAHKLKGAAGSLALNQLANLSGEVERHLKAGLTVDTALERMVLAMADAVRDISDYVELARVQPENRAIDSDRKRVLPLLSRTLQALNDDNPATVEPLLEQLGFLLPEATLAPLRAAVENFDFRGAERIAAKLATDLNLSMES